MIVKILKAISGIFIMPFCLKTINTKKLFQGKRVAIIGAANSLFDHKNGDYINSFDYVIRVNKALTTWKSEREEYTGVKSNILFHSFYENSDKGGGGKLDLELFSKFGVEYLIQPRNNYEGKRVVFNFFKKYLVIQKVYIFNRSDYQKLEYMFGHFKPTIGFCALYSALTGNCKELFITGFTFFKTPYPVGYRDHLLSMDRNMEHIKNQGQHDPDLEYEKFKILLEQSSIENIRVDNELFSILSSDKFDIPQSVSTLN